MRILYLLTGLLFAEPAVAGLTFCNDADGRQQVAIGYSDEGEWVSEGWFGLDAGECRTLIDGDLQKRYYYYAISRAGQDDAVGEYTFCTALNAFTIRGDEECSARGYSETRFRSIDTGRTALDFVVRVPPAMPEGVAASTQRSDVEPAQTVLSATSDLAPGSLGEPFTVVGRFQGCEDAGNGRYCAFVADGWEYYAYAGAGTPQTVSETLAGAQLGQRFVFTGDILQYNDISVEIALNGFAPAGEEDWSDSLFARVQGSFRSVQDPNYTAIVRGSTFREFYDGEPTGESNFYFAQSCDESPGDGPFMIRIERETQETMCLAILAAEADHFVTAPAGGWSETMWQRQ